MDTSHWAAANWDNEKEVGGKMKGSEAKMTGFMEGANKHFVIPVYQRKYD